MRIHYKILLNTLKKFNPFESHYNPVMLVVWSASVLTSVLLLYYIFCRPATHVHSILFLLVMLCFIWVMLFIINITESISAYQLNIILNRIFRHNGDDIVKKIFPNGEIKEVPASEIAEGDKIMLIANDIVPFNGRVVEGVAYIDESVSTGESQPFIAGKDYSHHQLNAGTRILSDSIVIECTMANEVYTTSSIINDIMQRRKIVGNESLLNIYLMFISSIFCLQAGAMYFLAYNKDVAVSFGVIIIFLICTLPTTVAALLTTINLSIFRKLLTQRIVLTNISALNNLCDIEDIIFDKTGILTQGDRSVFKIQPKDVVSLQEFLKALYISSYMDTTQEGKEIMRYLVNHRYRYFNNDIQPFKCIPFDVESRLSGCKIGSDVIYKGSLSSLMENNIINAEENDSEFISAILNEQMLNQSVIVLVKNSHILGYVAMKDDMMIGIQSVVNQLIDSGYSLSIATGDNYHVAKQVADTLGIQNIFCDANNIRKQNMIEELQNKGRQVFYIGDGMNDTKALLQANVGMAFGKSPKDVQKYADIIDFDNNPLKILKILYLAKQSMKLKGGLNLFSMFTDISKYVVIIPAIFGDIFPKVKMLEIIHFYSKETALLAALAFNSIILLAFLPLITKDSIVLNALMRLETKISFVFYALLGIVLPFALIKILDLIFAWIIQ